MRIFRTWYVPSYSIDTHCSSRVTFCTVERSKHIMSWNSLFHGTSPTSDYPEQLDNRKLRSLKVTLPEVKAIVAENDKQRFSLIPTMEHPSSSGLAKVDTATNDPSSSTDASVGSTETRGPTSSSSSPPESPSAYLIRANQGHSIKSVGTEGLLAPITEEAGNIPDVCVHGTSHRAWGLIKESGGLKKMTRNHVHFASGLPAGFKRISDGKEKAETTNEPNEEKEEELAAPVISGMRNSSTVLIFVDVKRALEAGIPFWLSANGVILSEGNAEGVVPLEVLERVEDRKGGKVLWRNGRSVD